MKTQKSVLWAFIDALGTTAYVALIALFFSNAEKLFDQKMPGILGPMFLLLLLVTSAAITGSLVFGRPVYMIYAGQKNEGFKMLFYTIGFLALIIAIVFLTLLL